MISLLLLLLNIEFGVERACSDSTIEVLEEFVFTIEQVTTEPKIFEDGSIKLRSSLSPACSLVNAKGLVQFDVTESGEITNYEIVLMEPARVHSRAIIKAILNGKVLPSAHGTTKNQVLVQYVQYKNKT